MRVPDIAKTMIRYGGRRMIAKRLLLESSSAICELGLLGALKIIAKCCQETRVVRAVRSIHVLVVTYRPDLELSM